MTMWKQNVKIDDTLGNLFIYMLLSLVFRRREDRMGLLNRGVRNIWGQSPSQREIQQVYEL